MRALALIKKELLETLGDRNARRGGFLQAGIFVLVLGVLMPLSNPKPWLDGSPLAIIFFAFMPGLAAATIAADAFAGERERRTLETLLATPLSEQSILAGKLAAAIVFGLMVGVASLLVASISLTFAGGVYVPAPALAAGAIGAALSSSALMASVAVVISMLIPSQRPAQQVSTLSSSALLGLGAALWGALRLAITWRNVFAAEALVVLLAIIVFEVARALFKRDRFFRDA